MFIEVSSIYISEFKYFITVPYMFRCALLASVGRWKREGIYVSEVFPGTLSCTEIKHRLSV
jgi:hypothetical protein